MTARPPKVTVYIPCHNYGRYLPRAVDSVLAQTFKDWELILIDDGSTDDTPEVLKRYESLPRVRTVTQRKSGLSVSNNVALRLSSAKYLMRLDADDSLDENALLVMTKVLDTKPEVGLVYPDYYLVDEAGEILELVRRKKIGTEAKLLDLPAHGACTMLRRECLTELGGYEERISCQDGYDLWLRFLERFKPYNVNVPLFYYCQHEGSLTKDESRILRTRAQIKRRFVEKHKNGRVPKVLGLIPVMRASASSPDNAFTEVAGKPLLWHTLSEALKTPLLDRVVVTSNDDSVRRYVADEFPRASFIARPDELAKSDATITKTVTHVLSELGAKRYRPEAVMLLYITAPLRRAMHIEAAVDAMTIFDVDSVVSVTEELSYCYQHGADGLQPVQRRRDLRLEKHGLYKENGAVLLAKTAAIHEKDFVGGRVGHTLMLPEESVRIKSAFDLWLAQKVLSEWRKPEVRA